MKAYRIKPPKLVLPSKLSYPDIELSQMPNGVQVKSLFNKESDIVKIALYLNAGNVYDTKHLVSTLTGQMMLEGTKNKTSKQLQQEIEHLGIELNIDTHLDFTAISLKCLKKATPKALAILKEVLTECSFPEEEFEIKISENKKNVQTRDENIKSYAWEMLNKAMFGTKHAYGYITQLENYDNILTSDLKSYYDKFISSRRATVFLSGNFDTKLVVLVHQMLGEGWEKDVINKKPSYAYQKAKDKVVKINRKNSKQVAIIFGKPTIHTSHEDFSKFAFVNYILGGGSLGSRLNKNLRIDKGYTYGAYSSFNTYAKFNRWAIHGEFQKEAEKDVIKQIKIEVDKLQNDLVNTEELEVARNKVVGSLLSNFDGAFSLSDTLVELHRDGLNWSYFENYLNTVLSITPEEVRSVAQKYMELDDSYLSICG